MDYIFREYKIALIFYIVFGGLVAAFAPWMTGPFWLDWILTVIGASIWFVVYVFLRAFYLSIFRRKRD